MSGQGEPDRQDAPAARRNVAPIGDVLQGCLPASGLVLEIASGSGQHACAFGTRFPALTFQPSDPDARSRASISAWIAESGTSNVAAPLDIDVMAPRWWMNAGERPAAMMAINMIHISPWQASEGLMAGAGSLLAPEGLLYVYGPFRRGGRHISQSNIEFDESLRARNANWGVRDIEDLDRLAASRALRLDEVIAMPANNLSLIFRRK